MPRRKYKITRLPKSKRWRKKYKGRQFYLPMSEYPTAELAWAAWLKKKTEIDLEDQANKPHRAEYEKAIKGRQELAQWCKEQGDHEQAAIFQQETDLLLDRFNKSASPPPLTIEEQDPLSSVALQAARQAESEFNASIEHLPVEIQEEEIRDFEARYPFPELQHPDVHKARAVWRDRLFRLTPTETEKAVQANIEAFLKRKHARVETGQLSKGYYGVLHAHLKRFREWIGGSYSVESILSKTLLDYHTHLMEQVNDDNISKEYAKDNMGTVRSFVRWCWELDLCGLPRNIDSKDLSFNLTPSDIDVFTKDEIASLLEGASERTALFILLSLNTGMTQQDITDLKHKEVNWKKGTITRRRSKTKEHKNVPTVKYILWSKTFELLKKYRSTHPELALVNERGEPLKRENVEGGVYGKTDNVKTAFYRLTKKLKIKKTFKLIRKTSASELAKHRTYKGYVSLFLGHSPKSIAERHYASPSQDLFDEAIVWLGRQFDMTK